MNTLDLYSKSVFRFLCIITLPLLLGNGIFYLLASFIAQSWDYETWWVYNSTFGRVLVSLMQVSILINSPLFWKKFIGK
jgi:hypothetical protein